VCSECYVKAGSPTEWTPQTARFVDLVQSLYAVHPTGGPLHSVLDDWNLAGTIAPWWDGFTVDELDEPYFEGWPIADLDPGAQAVAQGLGRTTREVCEELAAILNSWTVDQRRAGMAYVDGLLERPA
jgi:hypothetical protein